MPFEPVLLANIHKPDSHTLRVYEQRGGYKALRKALKTPPELLVEEVKNSGLRGRGGAGFPTGTKWGFLPKGLAKPVYLCVNADESEPGTFKDREIMERDPHMMIEGTIISAYAIKCSTAYVYIRGEFYFPYARKIWGLSWKFFRKQFGAQFATFLASPPDGTRLTVEIVGKKVTHTYRGVIEKRVWSLREVSPAVAPDVFASAWAIAALRDNKRIRCADDAEADAIAAAAAKDNG